MFSLRREIQAVTEYAELGDQPHMEKWAGRFAKHYLSIAEMVPEWKDELDYEWLEQLRQAAHQGNRERVLQAVKKIGQGCNACHREYRATVALLEGKSLHKSYYSDPAPITNETLKDYYREDLNDSFWVPSTLPEEEIQNMFKR